MLLGAPKKVVCGPLGLTAPRSQIIVSFDVVLDSVRVFLDSGKGLKDASITEMVIRAVGIALEESPNLCGHIAFDSFYPTKSTGQVRVSVMVDVGDLYAVPVAIDLVNIKPLAHLVEELKTISKAASSHRNSGKMSTREWIVASFDNFPFLGRLVDSLLTFLSCTLGVTSPLLGITGHPYGSCLVVSSGNGRREEGNSGNGSSSDLLVMSSGNGLQGSVVPITVTVGGARTPGGGLPEVVGVAVAVDSRAASVPETRAFAARVQALLENPSSLLVLN